MKQYIEKIDDLLKDRELNIVNADLPIKRIEKIDRIRTEKGKRQSLAAGLLLKRALFDVGINDLLRYNKDYEYGTPVGKAGMHGDILIPGINKGDDIYFSLSHSEDLVMCVTDTVNVGCDIEKISDKDIKTAERVLSPEQYEVYINLPRKEQQDLFFSVWTAKESVKKAEEATSLSLSDIEVDIKSNKAITSRNMTYSIKINNREIEGYCICIARKYRR